MRSFPFLVWLFVAGIIWLVLPLVITSIVGTVWIYREGWIWRLVAFTGVSTLTGWWIAHEALGRLRAAVAAVPPPAPCWTPLAQQARESVRAIALRVQAEDLPWDQPETIGKVFLEVLDTVARHYFPESEKPLLQRPLPHVLGAIEKALQDLRRLVTQEVPFGTQVTMTGWLRLKELATWAWPATIRAYQAYRVVRMVNPAPAVVREGVEWLSCKLTNHSLSQSKGWIIQQCVTRIGDYAIQLYSGDLVLEDEYRGPLAAPVRLLDFAAEPLQVLVLGQVKAGKSSLVNALLGEMRAPVDALPATEQIDLYELAGDDLPPVIVRDTPGYAAVDESQADPFTVDSETIKECDLVLLVCSARSSARNADHRMVDSLRRLYPPAALLPPLVCVLTHIDSIPRHLIAEAVKAVADDLGLAPVQVVPVCTQWGHADNVRAVVETMLAVMPTAERLKQIRCIRQIRRQRDEASLLENLLRFGRLGLGWAGHLLQTKAK